MPLRFLRVGAIDRHFRAMASIAVDVANRNTKVMKAIEQLLELCERTRDQDCLEPISMISIDLNRENLCIEMVSA